MEFKEYCEHRWIFLAGGIFWSILIPIAYYLAFSQLMEQSIGVRIFVSFAMMILMLGAIVILANGISGIIANGKTHLILHDSDLQIIINSGKKKGKVYDINYAEMEKFYFISKGAKKDKFTGEYYIKENARGTINFDVGDDFYCACIYNAVPATRYILDRIQIEQIDNSRNELDKNGNYQPKD